MALRLLSNRVKLKTIAHVHCKTKIFGLLRPNNNHYYMWSSPLFYCTNSTNPILHYYQNVKREYYTPLDFDGDVNYVTNPYYFEEVQRSNKIMSFAQFAVDEHNKRENSSLKLVSVLGAEADDYGTRYQIALETTDADKKAFYIAMVDGPGQWFSKLEFKYLEPVHDPLSEEYTEKYYNRRCKYMPPPDDMVDDLVKNVVVCLDAENDGIMKSLAHFAIGRYNKKEDANLEFVRVIRAMTKYIHFRYYDRTMEACDVWRYITLEATNNGQQETYRAKLWENRQMFVDALIELKLVDGASKYLPLCKNY